MINLSSTVYLVKVQFPGSTRLYSYISCFKSFRPGMTLIVDSPSTGLTRVECREVTQYLGTDLRHLYKKYKPIIGSEHEFARDVVKYKEDLVAIKEQETRRKNEQAMNYHKQSIQTEIDVLKRSVRELEQRLAVL